MAYKILHNKKNIKDFENHVVFAPNGFGKTQFSLYLRDVEREEGKNVGLYTSREINDLIKIGDNQIFIGKYAVVLKRIDEIRNAFAKSNPIHNLIGEYYKHSISEYYSNSFYFKKYKFNSKSKIDTLLTIIRDNYDDGTRIRNLNFIFDADQFLDFDIYNMSYQFMGLNVEEFLSTVNKEEIPTQIFDSLQSLRDYLTINKKTKCPLCGHDYIKTERLLEEVTKTLNGHISVEHNETVEQINYILLEINKILRKKKASPLRAFFEEHNIDKDDKAGTILTYLMFCDDHTRQMGKMFGDLEIDVESEPTTIIRLAYEFIDKESILENERKTNLKFGNDFTNFIKSEIESLLDLRGDGVVLSKTMDTLSFVDENGRKIRTKCTDYFSESQLKRIVLILINGYIHFLNYDCIILDDPIDSYDDYFFDIACEYISEMLENATSTRWFLFTNNYNFLIKLAEHNKHLRFVIFNDNPNLIHDTGKDNLPPLRIMCGSRDVKILNVNEMILLSKYVANKPTKRFVKQTDFDVGLLPFLSFMVTFRNMRDILRHNYDGVVLGYAPNIFDDLVSEHVERCFMHYNRSVSKKTTLSDFYKIYCKLFNVFNNTVFVCRDDKRSAVECREMIFNTKFKTFTGNRLLNLILYKILVLSHLKFLIEVKLIDGLQSLGIKVKAIENTYCLGRKIGVASKKASGNPLAENLVNRISNIHKKYSGLINDYDHALSRMYPPYLSTSFKDMKRLKEEIDKI